MGCLGDPGRERSSGLLSSELTEKPRWSFPHPTHRIGMREEVQRRAFPTVLRHQADGLRQRSRPLLT